MFIYIPALSAAVTFTPGTFGDCPFPMYPIGTPIVTAVSRETGEAWEGTPLTVAHHLFTLELYMEEG
jgi:hypothetical protein